MDRGKEAKSMNTFDPHLVYYALHKATPPNIEDGIVGRNISIRLTDEEQQCILEQATQIQPMEEWFKEACSYFEGSNIYYRNSRWTNTSKLIVIDTSTGQEGWLYNSKDDALNETTGNE
jgi:hypothetical protein